MCAKLYLKRFNQVQSKCCTYECHNFSIFQLSTLCPPAWPLPDSKRTVDPLAGLSLQASLGCKGSNRVPGCIRATDVLPALPGVTLERPVAACPLAPAGSHFNLPKGRGVGGVDPGKEYSISYRITHVDIALTNIWFNTHKQKTLMQMV